MSGLCEADLDIGRGAAFGSNPTVSLAEFQRKRGTTYQILTRKKSLPVNLNISSSLMQVVYQVHIFSCTKYFHVHEFPKERE